MRLITKLTKIFKNKKSIRLGALALIFAIGFSATFGVGCKSKGSKVAGNQSNISSSVENSSNSSGQEVDITKFSKTLQTVLTDSYYESLIYNAKYQNYDYAINHPAYRQIPYGFL